MGDIPHSDGNKKQHGLLYPLIEKRIAVEVAFLASPALHGNEGNFCYEAKAQYVAKTLIVGFRIEESQRPETRIEGDACRDTEQDCFSEGGWVLPFLSA